MNFGLNPVNSKRKQPCAAIGFVAFDGFHQADIAFLYQVGLVKAVAVVAAGDRYNDAEVRKDQLLGSLYVASHFAFGQVVFFFRGKQRDAVYCVDILIQAAVSAGDGECGDLTCGH